MKLDMISFTEQGFKLSQKLEKKLTDSFGAAGVGKPEIRIWTKCGSCRHLPQYEPRKIAQWAGEQMERKAALLFIGACGIAVRAVAPWMTDKLHDSPVLVMDELGQYVIPILSGHMGGANELAGLIAAGTGAVPVITTATDLNGAFAVDLFAKKNHLTILNKEGIAVVSARLLAGEPVTISIESGHGPENPALPAGLTLVPYPPQEPVNILVTSRESGYQADIRLCPQEYVIGMGCRKGKEPEKIRNLIRRTLASLDIKQEQVLALASIDLKAEEPGFTVWSRMANVPFFTYSARELMDVPGQFSVSEFVKSQVGVDNVCERAALCGCGLHGGRLIRKKCAEDGMTIAIAKREWSVRFDEA